VIGANVTNGADVITDENGARHIAGHRFSIARWNRGLAPSTADWPVRQGHLGGHADLLLARSVSRVARTAVGVPGAHGELQSAVVAVAGLNGPVAARLTRRDGIPVHPTFRIRGAGSQRHRSQCERPSDGGQPKRFADVLQLRSFRQARAKDSRANAV
jgi:hypothetical protein